MLHALDSWDYRFYGIRTPRILQQIILLKYLLIFCNTQIWPIWWCEKILIKLMGYFLFYFWDNLIVGREGIWTVDVLVGNTRRYLLSYKTLGNGLFSCCWELIMDNQESGRVTAFIKASFTFGLDWFLIHFLLCNYKLISFFQRYSFVISLYRSLLKCDNCLLSN